VHGRWASCLLRQNHRTHVRLWPQFGYAIYTQTGARVIRDSSKRQGGHRESVFCTVVERKIVILHAYIKKSRKTPERELEVARKRLADVQRRSER